MKSSIAGRAYDTAREQYAEAGVDTDAALQRLASVSISLHCWQGDDVGGFEGAGGRIGRRPGGDGELSRARRGRRTSSARDAGEGAGVHSRPPPVQPARVLRRVRRHARRARRHRAPTTSLGWIDWARERGIGLDFNPTFFSHPLAADNFTLSHRDAGVRAFWIRHGIACRRIGAAMGAALRHRRA